MARTRRWKVPVEGKARTRRSEKLEGLRKEHWPDADCWGVIEKEPGFFKAPRTLPLLLSLIAGKGYSDDKRLILVYVELLSRHWEQGVIELGHEADHAFACGWKGQRAIRSWQERIKKLEDLGLIKTYKVANRYKYIALIHPTTAVQQLKERGTLPPHWWSAYTEIKREFGEPTFNERAEGAPLEPSAKLDVIPAQ